nr:MAG TPA: regulatory protein [Caudoviricetes sp.]DAY33563.1 MAG TPA: regulatory protein [Caudoviricetes sp.]
MNLADFCEATGQDKRKVYALLKSRYYPEKLLSGGYASLKQRKSPIFITEEVLKWLR